MENLSSNLGKIIATEREQFLQEKKGLSIEDAKSIITKELAELESKTTGVIETTNNTSGAEYVPAENNTGRVVDVMVKHSGLMAELSQGYLGENLAQNTAINIVGETGRARVKAQYTSGQFFSATPTNGFITDKVLANQKVLKAQIAISTEHLAFSVVEAERLATEAVGMQISQSIENAVLNADSNSAATGNINSKDQLFTSASYLDYAGAEDDMYNFNNGIRDSFLAGTSGVDYNTIGAISGFSDIANLIKLIPADFSTDDYFLAMDHKTRATLLANTDFSRYLNRGGPNNTMRTGKLPQVGGMNLVVSKYMRMSDTDGKIFTIAGGSGTALNTKGTMILCRKNVIQHGFCKPIEYAAHKILGQGMLVEAAIPFGFANINKLGGSPARIIGGISVTV